MKKILLTLIVFGSFGAFAQDSCPYDSKAIKKLNICVDDTPDTYGFHNGLVVTYSNVKIIRVGDQVSSIFHKGERVALKYASTLNAILGKQKIGSLMEMQVRREASGTFDDLTLEVESASSFFISNSQPQSKFLIQNSDMNKFPIADGSSYLYGNWEVLSNYIIGSLNVRHLRMIDGYKIDGRFASKIECKSGFLDALDIHGPINEDIHLIVDKVLQQVKTCQDESVIESRKTKVYLTSGGGYLQDGFSLARIFRTYDVQAIIPSDQICASSCAAAFLGAKEREMGEGSSILFHAPYNVKTNYKKELEIKCQKTNRELEDFYLEMLGEENGNLVYDRTMSYCSTSSGWTLNDDAASLFGITTQ